MSNEHQRRKPRCNKTHRGKVSFVGHYAGWVCIFSMYFDVYIYIFFLIYMNAGLMVVYQGTK